MIPSYHRWVVLCTIKDIRMKKLNRRGSGTTFCQAFQMHTASSMYIMKKKQINLVLRVKTENVTWNYSTHDYVQ
jgi:hypothetical protein